MGVCKPNSYRSSVDVFFSTAVCVLRSFNMYISDEPIRSFSITDDFIIIFFFFWFCLNFFVLPTKLKIHQASHEYTHVRMKIKYYFRLLLLRILSNSRDLFLQILQRKNNRKAIFNQFCSLLIQKTTTTKIQHYRLRGFVSVLFFLLFLSFHKQYLSE